MSALVWQNVSPTNTAAAVCRYRVTAVVSQSHSLSQFLCVRLLKVVLWRPLHPSFLSIKSRRKEYTKTQKEVLPMLLAEGRNHKRYLFLSQSASCSMSATVRHMTSEWPKVSSDNQNGRRPTTDRSIWWSIHRLKVVLSTLSVSVLVSSVFCQSVCLLNEYH